MCCLAVLCCVTHTSGRRTYRCSTVHPRCNPHWSAVLCAGSLQWHVGDTNKAGKARHPLSSRQGQHSKAASLADRAAWACFQANGTESVTHMSGTARRPKQKRAPFPASCLAACSHILQSNTGPSSTASPTCTSCHLGGCEGGSLRRNTEQPQSAQHTHMLALPCLSTHIAALVTA